MKSVLLLVGLAASVVGQGYVYLHENQQDRTPNPANNLFDPSAYVYKPPSAVNPNVFAPANQSPSTPRHSSPEYPEVQDPPIQPERNQNLPPQHYEIQRLPVSSPPDRSPTPSVTSSRQFQAPSEPQQAGLPASTSSRGGPSLEEIYASLERRVNEYHKQQREQQRLDDSFHVPSVETLSRKQHISTNTQAQPVPPHQQPDIYSQQYNNNNQPRQAQPVPPHQQPDIHSQQYNNNNQPRQTQPVPPHKQPDIYSQQYNINNNQHRQTQPAQPQQPTYTNQRQYNNRRVPNPVQHIRHPQSFQEPVPQPPVSVGEPQSSGLPASTINGQGSKSLEELYAELEKSVLESQKQQKQAARRKMTSPRQPVYAQVTDSNSQYNNRPHLKDRLQMEDASVVRRQPLGEVTRRRPVSITREKRRQRQRRRRLRPQTSAVEKYNDRGRVVSMSRPSRAGGRTVPVSHHSAPARSAEMAQPEVKNYDADLAVASLPPDTDGDGIPGEAGVDYPTLNSIPRTSFSCIKQPLNGYYADLETSCQVVHMCQAGGVQDSYLCPNGTIFSQAKFSCQWWYKVNCAKSVNYYDLNDALYKVPEPPNEERRRN
ncbi:altered inheritance of mitochondria protein 3-like [Limulus polyphemus]|uniref:Altered inheritance of mitochondria protein 3-like n=1 Tax=Limulus polyphemus TaxID=6850 RepID=A0ABM1SDY5_LIMPO|nr:altered inheritance of mitochondria protein 3-like [Limulus polyphemus]